MYDIIVILLYAQFLHWHVKTPKQPQKQMDVSPNNHHWLGLGFQAPIIANISEACWGTQLQRSLTPSRHSRSWKWWGRQCPAMPQVATGLLRVLQRFLGFVGCLFNPSSWQKDLFNALSCQTDFEDDLGDCITRALEKTQSRMDWICLISIIIRSASLKIDSSSIEFGGSAKNRCSRTNKLSLCHPSILRAYCSVGVERHRSIQIH